MSTFHSLEEAREYFKNDLYAMSSGMTIEALSEGGAVCAMEITKRHQNAEGGLMGGAILALARMAAQPLEAEEITAFLDRSRKLLAMLVK